MALSCPCYHLTRKLSRLPYSFTSSAEIMDVQCSHDLGHNNTITLLGFQLLGLGFSHSFITPNWLPKLASVTQVISSFGIYKGTRFSCLHTEHTGVQRKSETASKLPHACTNSYPHTPTQTHNKHTQTPRMEEVILLPRRCDEGPIIHCC